MESLTLNYHPSREEICSFLPFLKNEYDENGYGMYCNWDTIILRNKNDQIISLHLNDKPIAFVTWHRTQKVVNLEIIWTLKEYRRHGYGLKFQELLIKEFKKRGDVALVLSCATKEGLSLAKRSGFIPRNLISNFDNENLQPGPNAKYIKILKNSDALVFDKADLVVLCYEKYHNDNSLCGEFCLSADFEKKPVYYYLNENWECKIIYKGKVIHESKMKYILKDLKIKTYNYIVACFDKKIIVPQHWLR